MRIVGSQSRRGFIKTITGVAGAMLASTPVKLLASEPRVQGAGDTIPAYKNKANPIHQRVADLLRRMTTEEKIKQLVNDAPANERLGIPRMKHAETLHGVVVTRAVLNERGFAPEAGSTVFPQAIALGSTWNPDLIEEIANAVAREACSLGVDQAYAPLLDVARDPRFGRVEETFGEDPYLVSRMGVAYINGLQGKGPTRFDAHHLLATGKHFVGYQDSTGGLNGAYAEISERTMREVHLPPFEAAVKEAGLAAIMPAHTDINGIPAHMNTWLLDDILRKEWGFKGFVISDNVDVYRLFAMHHIARNESEAAILGLKAGVDMELDLSPKQQFATYQSTLLTSIRKGWISESYVDKAAARILEAKFKIGLFDGRTRENPKDVLGTPAHRDLARRAAEEAAVLLKNDGTLPLAQSKYKTIAIIGPHGNYVEYGDYSGTGSARGVSLATALPAFLSNVRITFAEGTTVTGTSTAGFPDALRLAKEADLVIMAVGGSHETCGEGIDRDELGLPGVQQELFDQIAALGKPIVTVLTNGRPLTVESVVTKSNAVIEAWYLGSEAGNALASILIGKANPSGKLSMTFPRKVGQLPSFYQKKPAFTGLGRGKYYDSDDSPLFPFGFGLSYTTFEISNLRLSSSKIRINGTSTLSVDVKNTGTIAGENVVQMYISQEFASVGRWDKELKGFQKVALQPGETMTVVFKVGFPELSFFNRELKKVVEPGRFFVRIGDSSTKLTSIDLFVLGDGKDPFLPDSTIKKISDSDDAEVGAARK